LTYLNAFARLGSVLRCLARVVTICALCCAVGLHWLALQSIAWTSMIIDYSKHGSLCQAVEQTFDGAHPCSLCHIVNTGKTTENKSPGQLLTSKIDMICTRSAVALVRLSIDFEYASCEFSFSKTWQSPPVPPPRTS
jgi:hypothetical protein